MYINPDPGPIGFAEPDLRQGERKILMKRMPPIQKNDMLELPIQGLTADGQGVGRIGSYAVFVKGALPGEVVRAHTIKANSSYGVAKLVQVLKPSPDRVSPRCPAYARCGGCSLQHLSYEAQLRAKTEQVRDALARLGGFSEIQVQPALGMEGPWAYRNKGSLSRGPGGRGAANRLFRAPQPPARPSGKLLYTGSRRNGGSVGHPGLGPGMAGAAL